MFTEWETLTADALLIPGAKLIRIDSIGIALAAFLETFTFLAFLQ